MWRKLQYDIMLCFPTISVGSRYSGNWYIARKSTLHEITYGTLSNKTFWCLMFNTMQFTPITLQYDCPIMIQLTAICRILKQIFNKTCFYWWFISEVIALHKFGYFAAIYAIRYYYDILPGIPLVSRYSDSCIRISFVVFHSKSC